MTTCTIDLSEHSTGQAHLDRLRNPANTLLFEEVQTSPPTTRARRWYSPRALRTGSRLSGLYASGVGERLLARVEGELAVDQALAPDLLGTGFKNRFVVALLAVMHAPSLSNLMLASKFALDPWLRDPFE